MEIKKKQQHECHSKIYVFLQEHCYISSKRVEYFYATPPQPHQFTVLVRGIPISSGSSCSETVERFFTEFHPTTYLSHAVVRRTSKLQGLIVSIFFLMILLYFKFCILNFYGLVSFLACI